MKTLRVMCWLICSHLSMGELVAETDDAAIMKLVESARATRPRSVERSIVLGQILSSIDSHTGDEVYIAAVSHGCEYILAGLIRERGPFWYDAIRIAERLRSDVVLDAILETCKDMRKSEDDEDSIVRAMSSCADTGSVSSLVLCAGDAASPQWQRNACVEVIAGILLRPPVPPIGEDHIASELLTALEKSEGVGARTCMERVVAVRNELFDSLPLLDHSSLAIREAASAKFVRFGIPVGFATRLSESLETWTSTYYRIEEHVTASCRQCFTR